MLSFLERHEQRLWIARVATLVAALTMLALVGLLYTHLGSIRSASGAAVAMEAELALWGLGSLTVGALGVSFHFMRKYAALKDRALYDHLTKSANRHYFQEMLHREVKRARGEKRPLAFLMMDIDYFKHYNDRNGHLLGDRLLQEFSALIKNHMRTEDVFGRYGGEEFAMILPDTPDKDALEVAKRLCAIIRAHPFERGDLQPNHRLTTSMGVAIYEEGMTPVELVRRADEALYHAKRDGRDCVMPWNAKDRLALAAPPQAAPLNRRSLEPAL